ncbi:MAG: SulP family inorganic anion transporter [Actinobacteria bacterium]|nr:SulP family inorganic anion transporter [Actinomycetota bacterium]
MPAVAGLYAAFGVLLLYWLWGSSKELNVGPESTVAIMVATVLTPLAGQRTHRSRQPRRNACHPRRVDPVDRPPTDASEVGNVIEYPAGRPSSKDLHGRRQQRRRGPSGEHSPVPVSKALCIAHRHI